MQKPLISQFDSHLATLGRNFVLAGEAGQGTSHHHLEPEVADPCSSACMHKQLSASKCLIHYQDLLKQ